MIGVQAKGADSAVRSYHAGRRIETETVDTIADGKYPLSRPLFFYIKAAHLDVIPGLQEYAEFFVSDDIAGPFGPLAAYGLVADPELAETQAVVANRTTMGDM